MEAGIWMAEMVMAGCGIKEILRRERDLIKSTDGLRDSFKIDRGMRDEKRKITKYGCCVETAKKSIQLITSIT